MNGANWAIRTTFYLLAAVSVILMIPALAEENWTFSGVMLAIAVVCGIIGRSVKTKGKFKDL